MCPWAKWKTKVNGMAWARAGLCLGLLLSVIAAAAEPQRDLTGLSLEQLMDVEVTSVSRKQQKLREAAAAIYVITREDIRRSGFTSIPEALRMAPGLHVAQIDSHTWAITSRGFNGQFAGKMLVLIDGRSVYTPLFSGVYWDMQDVMLDDIERIEVIRGPGAAVWGANAVNGVINIITRRAEETQGTVVEAGAGTLEQGFGSVRHGGRIGDRAYYRVYGKFANRGEFFGDDELPTDDSWAAGQGGVRIDWRVSDRDDLTFIGNGGHSGLHLNARLPTVDGLATRLGHTHYRNSLGNFLARWTRAHASGADTAVQTYVDSYDRGESMFGERRITADIELQNRFRTARLHEFNWGVGYRHSTDETKSHSHAWINPVADSIQLFSGFVQDEIALGGESTWLTLGTKVERNDFTGFEIQPTVRLLWEPKATQVVWAAVSRAVRTPGRGERAGTTWIRTLPGTPQTGGMPVHMWYALSEAFDSQSLLALEGGYRFQPRKHVTFDLAGFYNIYGGLRTLSRTQQRIAMDPAPHLVMPLLPTNLLEGETWGLEVAGEWEPAAFWKLHGTYSWLDFGLGLSKGATADTTPAEVRQMPHHLGNARSQLDLPRRLQWDVGLYFSSSLSEQSGSFFYPEIPGYGRLDTRIAWQATPWMEFSVTGQNLLDNSHPEFYPEIFGLLTEVPRSFYGKVRWDF